MSSPPDNAQSGKIVPLNRGSWDEIIAAFESDLYRRGKSETTINRYGACLNIFSHFTGTH